MAVAKASAEDALFSTLEFIIEVTASLIAVENTEFPALPAKNEKVEKGAVSSKALMYLLEAPEEAWAAREVSA